MSRVSFSGKTASLAAISHPTPVGRAGCRHILHARLATKIWPNWRDWHRCWSGAAGIVARKDLFKRRDIARGGCHQLLRIIAQTQRKLQHVPGLLRFFPLGQFIHPSAIKLRSAQAFRIGGRIDLRHSPIGPSQLPARGRPMRPAVWRGTSQNAALAKDHHLTGLIQSLADQRHPRAAARHFGPAALDHLTDPFRSGPGFARAAPPQDHPGAPITFRWQLMLHGPKFEHPRQSAQLILGQLL